MQNYLHSPATCHCYSNRLISSARLAHSSKPADASLLLCAHAGSQICSTVRIQCGKCHQSEKFGLSYHKAETVKDTAYLQSIVICDRTLRTHQTCFSMHFHFILKTQNAVPKANKHCSVLQTLLFQGSKC